MLPRLFTLLLAVLLLAAPADVRAAEIVDAYAAVDDVELAIVDMTAPDRVSPPRHAAVEQTASVLPGPVLAGVFRPPRGPVG